MDEDNQSNHEVNEEAAAPEVVPQQSPPPVEPPAPPVESVAPQRGGDRFQPRKTQGAPRW